MAISLNDILIDAANLENKRRLLRIKISDAIRSAGFDTREGAVMSYIVRPEYQGGLGRVERMVEGKFLDPLELRRFLEWLRVLELERETAKEEQRLKGLE